MVRLTLYQNILAASEGPLRYIFSISEHKKGFLGVRAPRVTKSQFHGILYIFQRKSTHFQIVTAIRHKKAAKHFIYDTLQLQIKKIETAATILTIS